MANARRFAEIHGVRWDGRKRGQGCQSVDELLRAMDKLHSFYDTTSCAGRVVMTEKISAGEGGGVS